MAERRQSSARVTQARMRRGARRADHGGVWATGRMRRDLESGAGDCVQWLGDFEGRRVTVGVCQRIGKLRVRVQ